jgi:hypothetical protein
VLLGSIAYFYFRTAPPSIELGISSPAQIAIGAPFSLSVSLSNYSEKILSDATISVILPDGLSYSGEAQDQRVRQQSIGDVGPGSIAKQEIEVIAVKDPQTIKRVEAKVSYRIGAESRIQYQAQATGDVSIGQPAVQISFSLPEKVLSGENVTAKLNYENISGKDYPGLVLRVDYPPMFQKKNAEPKPTQDENLWDLGTLRAGEKGTIVISGIAAGPEQAVMNFSASMLATIRGEKYVLNTQASSVPISASALSVSVSLNDEKDRAVSLDESLLYAIRFRNNSQTTLENITIRATFAGEMYDFATVQTNASLNSLTNTFLWNTAVAPQLLKLNPGEEGSVTLPIKVKKSFPITRLGDKNYMLGVNVQAESPTVPTGTEADKTVAIASIESKVKGLLTVTSQGFFRDAGSGILNEGPYPPRVNQPTEYSIHWKAVNYATDVSGATVRAFVKSGARFTGIVKSTIDAKPEYNPSSGEIIWRIGSIAATKGVISAPIEAVFQLEHTPSVNQVGQRVELLGGARIEATDEFTGTALSGSDEEVTTDLPDDTSIKDGDRRVRQ